MQQLTINIDMDGVIYDFNGAMTSFAEVELDRKLPTTQTWNMWEAWGISREEFYRLFHDAINYGHVFRVGHEVPGAVNAVHELVAYQHRVRVVTSKKLRYPSSTKAAQIQVIRWLAEQDLLNKVELAFAHNKQGYQADVIIDDKPNLKWAQRGELNLLFAQPWNLDVPDEAYHGPTQITRVENWTEVLDQVRWHEEYLRPLDLGVGRGGV